MIFKISYSEMIMLACGINVCVFIMLAGVFVDILIIIYKIFEKEESR